MSSLKPLRSLSLIFCWSIITLAAFGQSEKPGQAIQWHRSFEEAQLKAKQTGKPLLVISTGLGWCAACELLERYVLSRPEFEQAVADRFIFVELTSEDGEDAESLKREAERKKFNERYICNLVPTTMLIDPSGQPFLIFSGFEEKDAIPSYVAKLDQAVDARVKRDEFMQKAKNTTGLQRAEHLDAALKSVDELLEGYKEHNDDPLLFFYPDTVREILELTNSQGPIADKYLERQKYRAQWRTKQDFFKPIFELVDKKDYGAAIELIDQKLSESLSEEVKERLESNRLSFLEHSERHEEALEYVRKKLTRPGLSSRVRDELIDREIVFLYHRLDRKEEGLALVDKQIAEAGENKSRRRKWLHMKTQMLLYRGPVKQSIAAYREYRELNEPNTDEWYEATALLGRELQRDGQYAEALQMIELFIAHDKIPQMTLAAADIAISLKKFDIARQYLAESRTIIDRLAKSERGAEREEAQGLQPHYEEIQKRLLTEEAKK